MPIKTQTPERQSSLFSEIGYDAPTETLAVKFRNGDVWHYSPVSQEEFAALEKVGGKYFLANIKNHKRSVKQS